MRKEVKNIIESLPRVLSRISEGKLYNWSTDFAWKEVSEILNKFSEQVKNTPWNDLTDVELDALGFGKWDEKSNLRLIPAYLYFALPQNLQVTSITGEVCELAKADTDARFGCLAFGIVSVDAR